MKISKFRVLLVLVAATVVFVDGLPRYRRLPERRVWLSRGVAPQPELVGNDARIRRAAASSDEERRRTDTTIRARTTDATDSRNEGRSTNTSQNLSTTADQPQDLESAGASLNAIVGRARTLTNQPVPYGRVVLRNTRTGLIEARTTADQEGRFSFVDVSQTGYVIELVGSDGSVIASSELVSVQNGDLKQATVRVAVNSSVRAVFGSTAVAPTVQEAVNRAVQNSTRDVSDSTIRSASPQ